ncbi:related to--dienoyl-coa isomerase precursor [Ceraceosorus bombacis]|uniref:Related to--dienoyl-coa isomerase n=1 Tax=Ceraceosorus bombacis TaxID=401625 RepID=A0A0P1BPF7_9BASI|nr:related to--dienoyl-coa isomerase precursor [Ceraceosorus bombacis]
MSSSTSHTYPQPYLSSGTSSTGLTFDASKIKLHKLVWEAPHVLRVSFDRKPVNSWIEPMWRELAAIFAHIRTDANVNAVVLSGEGRCFTAGLDLSSSSLSAILDQETDVARRAWRVRIWLRELQDALTMMEKCDRPIVAAVHDVAYGLAIDLLCCVDVRIAESKARFSIKEVDAGLAADVGTLQRFPKIVGNESAARELALTGREFDAQEALRIGFLSRVVEGGRDGVLAAAIAIAKDIASKAPIAARGTKDLLLHARDHSVDDGLAYTAAWNAAMLQSEDIPVAMAAVLQKKKPTFEKL